MFVDEFPTELLEGNKPFCLIRKIGSENIEIFEGNISTRDSLRDVQLEGGNKGEFVIFAVPFSQIREKGYPSICGDEKILCLSEASRKLMNVNLFISAKKLEVAVESSEIKFDISDEKYMEIVENIRREIRDGEGSSFVIPRKATATITNFRGVLSAVGVFRNFLIQERGAYWTFLLYDGRKLSIVGASPERHVTSDRKVGKIFLNPISGTFRRKERKEEVEREDFKAFLCNEKEINELFMVTDEELKMMSSLCVNGGVVVGPFLKEMSKVIHTEYELQGCLDTRTDWVTVFRKTMFCPTVVGSPLGNACRIIKKYERGSRGYYSGALGLVIDGGGDSEALDSCILIRTAEIAMDTGEYSARAGASIVQDSVPREEALECLGKLGATLRAFQSFIPCSSLSKPQGFPPLLLPTHISTFQQLAELRNRDLCRFWMQHSVLTSEDEECTHFRGKLALLINHEDDFIFMLEHILRCAGMKTSVMDWKEFDIDGHIVPIDLLVLGPGPGNPNHDSNAKIAKAFEAVKRVMPSLMEGGEGWLGGVKVLAVCLGHQLISRFLGFPVLRKRVCSQGLPRKIPMFPSISPHSELCGFYNSFCPVDGPSELGNAPLIEILRSCEAVEQMDGGSRKEILGIYIPKRLYSFQFHPESILTQNGHRLLINALVDFFA